MDDVKKVFVYENWNENKPSLLGILYVEGGKGKQVVSFEYAEGWINNVANNVILDPDLGLYRGRQYISGD